MAINIPQYQRQVQYQRTGMNNEEAQGFKSLASQLEQFSNTQQTAMDRAAALQGETSGQMAAAGKTSGVVMQDDSTIYSRSFNKGARMAYAAAIQTDIRENVSRIQRENSYDVTAYDTALGGYKKGLMSKMDSALIPHATQEFYALGSQGRAQVEGNIFQKNKEASFAAITKNLLDTDKLAISEVKSGSVEGYAKHQTQLYAMYDEAVENNLMDATAVEKLKDAFEERAYSAGIVGSFERTLQAQGIEQAQKGLDLFIKEKHDTLTETSQEAIEAKMKSLISTEQTKLNKIATKKSSELALKTKAAKDMLDGFNSVIDQGHLPDPQSLEAALKVGAGTEHEADIKGIQSFSNAYIPFIAMSAEAQANELAQAKNKKNMTESEAQVWKRLNEVHTKTIEEAKTNGLELFYKQGLTEGAPLPEINFDLLRHSKIVEGKLVTKTEEEKVSDKQKLTQQFLQNVDMANRASIHYGVKVPPLTTVQAKSLKHAIKEGNREEVIGMMSVITNGFGVDTPDAMAAVFENDTTAYTAVGGMVVTGTAHSMDVATDMLKGIDMMKDHPNLIAKDFDIKINEKIGLTYLEADMPEQHKTIINGTKALYAQYMVEAGKYGALKDNETDEELLNKAIIDFTGGYADMEIQGSGTWDKEFRIELPRDRQGKVQDVEQVESWMKGLTVADIDAMGGVRDMSSEEAVKLINLGYVQLITMGDGRYAVKTGREAAAVMIDSKTNEPFLLDYQIGKHFESTLGFTHETTESEITNKVVDEQGNEVVEETSLVDDAVDLIDTISDGVLDVATTITDNTVGKLADLIYDDETMDKVNAKKSEAERQRKEKIYEKKKNRKKTK
ncbi:MAG: hypothetical protein HON50_05325 [Candidatus Marinimicrobia bacterium]|jgi:hypothetical protein|nr:hypothetical protein [Candidatus Neomarinimicrobiota bacterium]